MEHLLKEDALRRRALAVLGADEDEDDRRRIRYAYYRRMLALHPDANPGDQRAHEKAALVNEAFQMALGKLARPQLLEDAALVEAVLGAPPTDLAGALSYEDWLKAQFYDMENRSIWA